MELKNNKQQKLNNIDNIGVIMWGLLGDVILRTPVINALKEIYPTASITVIVDPIGTHIFKNNPNINDIIEIGRSKKSKIKYHMNKVIGLNKIRKKRFDLLIDLYNNSSSKFLTKLSKARYRLGFYSNKGKYAYDIMSNIHDIQSNNTNMSIEYLKILYPLKPTLDYSIHPTLVIRPKIIQDMKKYLDTFKFNLNKVYILNLGSGGNEKIFENINYLKIVKYLYVTYNYIPAVICNPSQEYLQETFINDCLVKNNLPYIKLKTLSIEEIGAAMNSIKFIVTPDTGLLHIATATYLPILGLFIGTPADEVRPEKTIFVSLFQKIFNNKKDDEKKIYITIDNLIKQL